MNEQLSAILKPYRGSQDELIPILQHVQGEFGYLPEQQMFDVARFTGVSESKVYGIASFYAQFRFKPVGENTVMVCRGTACHVRGAQQVLSELSRRLGIEEGETTPDMKYTLETVACLGCCALAPCMTINKNVYGRLTVKEVAKIYESEYAGDVHEPAK
jgi:NADH-quinone oxidoreductase subunit E